MLCYKKRAPPPKIHQVRQNNFLRRRTRFSRCSSFNRLTRRRASTSPRAARPPRGTVTRSGSLERARSRGQPSELERWGRAKGHPRWTKRTPRPSAAIFASRLVELLSQTDEDHRAKIPGQCGGERQPSRAGPSVGRSATSAAEQLAIAQSCDQRGNNPPTQRGLLSTLTSTPQLTEKKTPQATVLVFSRAEVEARASFAFTRRSIEGTPLSRNQRCAFVHTITASPEEFLSRTIQHYVSPSSRIAIRFFTGAGKKKIAETLQSFELRRAVVDGFALLRFVVAAFF